MARENTVFLERQTSGGTRSPYERGVAPGAACRETRRLGLGAAACFRPVDPGVSRVVAVGSMHGIARTAPDWYHRAAASRGIGIGMKPQELAQLLAHFGIDGIDANASTVPELSSAVLYLQQVVGTQAVGLLDDATVAAARAAIERDRKPNHTGWLVRGYVRDADGGPAKDVEVVAFDRDLRTEAKLGSCATDATGRYEIAYDEAAFLRADRGYADVFVRARIGREVFESDLVFNAPRVVVLNLVRNPLPPLPEWLLVTRTLAATLNGVPPAEVTDAECDFLVRETSVSHGLATAYVAAHRLARTLQVEPALTYACIRVGMPADQLRFVAQPRGALTIALESAWVRNFVHRVADDVRDRFLAVVDRWRARSMAETQDEGTIAATLGKLLPDAESRRQVAAFFASREASEEVESVWKAAASDPRMSPHVVALRAMIELAGVFGSHPRLLDAMHDPGVLVRWRRQRPWTLADLAAEPRARVREIIDVAGPPDWLPRFGDLEPAESYRRAVERVLEEVEPTRRVSARLKEGSLGLQPASVTRAAASFLDDNPDFDLRAEPVQRYVARSGKPVDEPAMRLLVGMQRLLHLTPRLDEIKALQEAGFSSAARVANVPATRLRELTGLDDARARMLQASAQRRVLLGAVLAIAAKDSGGVAAVPGTQLPPDIQSLFGSQDYCECAECRAADGPAAYLVDLLGLLRDHGGNALAEFFTRRPDVAKLRLSCYNTTVALPQIDLVNEVLEGLAATSDEEASSEELRVAPRVIKADAYTELRSTTYPWGLPFELGTAYARALFEAGGWSRASLVDVFAASDEERALEYFAVPVAEAELLAAPTLLGLYGTADVGILQNVANLLDRTGVPPTDLFEAVAAEPSLSMVPEDVCDFSAMTLAGATEASLLRIGSFLRLRKRGGWSAETLRRLLAAIGGSGIPWIELWRYARWCEQRRVDPAEALAWLSGAGTPTADEALRRVLKLDNAELMAWLEILGAPKDGEGTDAFLRDVGRLRASSFSASEVQWILRADAEPPASAMTDAALGAALHGLRTDLANVTRSLEGGNGLADLRKLTALLYPAEQLEQAVSDILDGTGGEPDLSREERVAKAVDAARVRVRAREQGALLVQFIARSFAIERGWITSLFATPGGELVRTALLEAEGLVGDPATKPGEAAFVALRKLERLALLARRIPLSAREFAEIVAPTAGTDPWLDFSALATGASVAALLAVLDCSRLRRGLPRPFEVAAHRADSWHDFATALLASQGGLSNDALAFADAARPKIADNAKGFALGQLERLVSAMAVRAAFPPGVLTAQLLACAARSVEFDAAQALETALERALTPVRGTKVRREAHDRLRVERRDALVAARLANNSANPDLLLETLLVDTQVSPCVPTSRVKAAIGAAQLFIHRCIMGLEPSCSLSPDVAKWWRWMQNYRVWQANRKVFLYPENWIEPELRDDKTPPFRELESVLGQQDPTPTSVQAAIRGYVGTLRELGRLEIVAVFTESRPDCVDILHVVGRRWSQPRTHFYRQRVGQTGWTPWEKVEVDIEGEHVMVTVSSGRPTLIWPVFREERDPTGGVGATGEPAKRWAIRFFWIERDHGKWGSKRSMDPAIATTVPKSSREDRDYFAFRVSSQAPIRVAIEHFRMDLKSQISGAHEMRDYGEVTLGGCGSAALLGDLTSVEEPWAPKLEASAVDGKDTTGLPTLDSETSRPFSGKRALRLVPGGAGDVVQIFPSGNVDPKQPHEREYKLTVDVPDATFPMRPFVFQSQRDTFVIEPADAPVRFKSIGVGNSIIGKTKWGSDAIKSQVSAVGAGAVVKGSSVKGVVLPPDLQKPVSESDAPRYYRVTTLEHPHACELAQFAESWPLDALLSLATQRGEGLTKKPKTFVEFYAPDRVVKPYPVEDLDFSRAGAYAIYNWELFFHGPLLVAVQLMQSGRYEDALSHLQLIFDPTGGGNAGGDGPSRFWRFLPFHEVGTPTSVVDIVAVLGSGAPNKIALASVLAQLDAYRSEPFNPHVIARLRIGAYMRAVVMRYLDCLIAWGDQLFRRRTLEANSHATLLYVTALQILGERPRVAPRRGSEPVTVEQVIAAHDSLDLRIEDVLGVTDADSSCGAEGPSWPVFDVARFCVPANEKLLAYWDTVADRLFKIRHCQDIEGNAVALPLFEPPIDPALLVRATAAGVDIGRVMDESYVPLPSYRFPVVSQKALDLCNDVKTLGTELLAVLEKRDAEELARLRSTQEVALLDAARSVRQGQLAEAERQLAALERQRDLVEQRRAHYQEVLQRRIPLEREAEKKSVSAKNLAITRGELEIVAAIVNALPNYSYGTNNSIIWGMPNLGAAFEATARAVGVVVQNDLSEAAMASAQAAYARRSEDWDFQGRYAAAELRQIDQQVAAAEIRVAMAERELANHDRQRENARAIDAQMRSKFTSRELFDWMAREAATAYSAAFQLALDMARRAERCFQFERGAPGQSYIGRSHWDDLRRGLLAGNRLNQELRQMELAYLDENRRDYEITKHVSLSLLDGNQLFVLRFAGACTIELDETLFDLDHPGHYMRRLKSVSLTIPAIVGAHASINAKLTLERSRIRKTGAGGLAADEAFVELPNGVESVVTSGGQNDSGMFETNLRDERYLPFEGAGAISTWRLELRHQQNRFDPASLTDVILHLRYTAREGAEALRTERSVVESPSVTRLFSLEHDFSAAWAATAEAREAGRDYTLDLDFTPFLPRHGAATWQVASLVLLPAGQTRTATSPTFTLRAAEQSIGSSGHEAQWPANTLENDDDAPRRVEFGEVQSADARLLLDVTTPAAGTTARLGGAMLVVSLLRRPVV